jgi:DNA mismatch repair ATPase MutS
LHGTNSHDRRLGAAAIVRSLVDRGAIGLVTTHDLALTQIADDLGTRAANVHFEDQFESGTLRFDYVMRPGVVQNSNALALMRAVGLEVCVRNNLWRADSRAEAWTRWRPGTGQPAQQFRGFQTGNGEWEKSLTFRVTMASNPAATAAAIRMLSSKSLPDNASASASV